jgi:PadR family transcriptional regulator, regulatory protein PadR
MGETLPVVKGMLDALVLRAASRASMHGFEITEWIEERSGGELELEEAAVYQALYRLEARGLISADWAVTPNNRRARYYRITRKGRDVLRAETESWLRSAQAVTAVLTGPGTEPR